MNFRGGGSVPAIKCVLANKMYWANLYYTVYSVMLGIMLFDVANHAPNRICSNFLEWNCNLPPQISSAALLEIEEQFKNLG